MHMYLTYMRTCTCILPTCVHVHVSYLATCVHAHVSYLHAYNHMYLTYMRTCTRILPTCVYAHVSYFEAMETIEFECFDESVVMVRLSVHWTTTISPLRYVATSPFFCLFVLVAAGMFFLLHITVPVRVVPR